MKKIIILIIVFTIISNYAIAQDLSDYPDYFIGDGGLDVVIVVGDLAPPTHVLAQTKIVLSLTSLVSERILGLTKLASEVDGIDDINIISIGNACDNNITESILQYPIPCDKDLEEGKATIEYYETESDKVHIVLNALTGDGIKEAADILSSYEDHDLTGDIFEISYVVESDESSVSEDEIPRPELFNTNENDEKQKIVEDLENKISSKENKNGDLKEENNEDEEIIVIESKEFPITIKEKEGLVKKFFNWFLSLFEGK